MSDEEQRTPEALHGRLIRLETQRNAALGLVLLFASGLGAGAWNVSQQTTRLDERVTRLAVDVQSASVAIAGIVVGASAWDTGSYATEPARGELYAILVYPSALSEAQEEAIGTAYSARFGP